MFKLEENFKPAPRTGYSW